MIVYFFLAVALLAAAIVYERLTRNPGGRHAFADPADLTDPDGKDWAAGLKDDPADTSDADEPDDSRHWEHRAPRPPVVEVLTGPGTTIPALPRGTGQFPALPPDAPPAGQLGPPADPYTTGELPALLATGHITPAQMTDRLAGKYLTAPQVTP